MAILTRNFQPSMYNPTVASEPASSQQLQSLEQNLVARETTKFYEDYFNNQQQVELDAFAATVAKKMYSTSCDQASAAAADIQATCAAFHAQAHALKVTANTLAAVRLRLDAQIAQQVQSCGGDASCVLEKHIEKVGTELVAAQTKHNDVQTWLTTLQTWHSTTTEVETTVASNGSAAFGSRLTNAEAMQASAATGTAELPDEMLVEVRPKSAGAPGVFAEETISAKASRRHR